MTKVEAIRKLMEDNDGTATWDIIYSNIEKYYPAAKEMKEWQAGIRECYIVLSSLWLLHHLDYLL